MGKRILLLLALLCISSVVLTCGENVTKASGGIDVQIAKDVDLYPFSCSVAEDGQTIYIQESNETVVCMYDEYLENWAWIPKKK
ncbi:hypothetical protein [uncultured Fibrobacter sp.]|uniref:hypothetical protein n=1 Tax=uncultured Fibrobacter sp. TaxID=261512 RepID=UPI0025F23957|nr:hypothetical protein [uncultured Fibrobacter sp.]